jgi:hypothetical protein
MRVPPRPVVRSPRTWSHARAHPTAPRPRPSALPVQPSPQLLVAVLASKFAQLATQKASPELSRAVTRPRDPATGLPAGDLFDLEAGRDTPPPAASAPRLAPGSLLGRLVATWRGCVGALRHAKQRAWLGCYSLWLRHREPLQLHQLQRRRRRCYVIVESRAFNHVMQLAIVANTAGGARAHGMAAGMPERRAKPGRWRPGLCAARSTRATPLGISSRHMYAPRASAAILFGRVSPVFPDAKASPSAVPSLPPQCWQWNTTECPRPTSERWPSQTWHVHCTPCAART